MRKILITGMILTGMLTITTPAIAHEKRTVADKYEFTVGFAAEPAYAGQMNGIDLQVKQDGKPVEGLEDNLSITLTREDVEGSLTLPLKRKYNEPGRYTGHFLPTQPGKYIVQVKGKINNTPIDERFESGNKFQDVQDPAPVSFP